MAAEDEFTWRIGSFSTLTEPEIHSPTFSLEGHQWTLSLHPTGIMGFMSTYLHFDGSQPSDNLFSLLADFHLTIVNQLNRRDSLETTFREVCIMGIRAFKASAIWVAKFDLAPRGFLVDDTLVLEARIRKCLKATLYSDLLTLRTVLNQECPIDSYLCGFKDATLRDISDRIPRTKEELRRMNGIGRFTIAKYGDRFLQTIESAISNYYGEEVSGSKGNDASDSAKRKRECATTEPSKAINSLTKPLITKKKVARTSTTTSPSSSNVRAASKNLIAKISTMANSGKSTPVDEVQVSTNDADHGSALLMEHKGKLAQFFEMPVEAICQANSFDGVREVVLKISELGTDPFEKRVLKDLLSRLVEFRSTTPKCLSVIESSPAIETSNIQTKKQIEGSLLERQNQLTLLDSEVLRIEEDQLKVDAEIKQLLTLKEKLVHEKNSALDAMEAANRETARELREFERKQAEHERATDDLRRAKEKLAQNNASWKLFKENLALQGNDPQN